MFKTILTLSVLILTSCTSYFVRKECEQVDWYKYGQGTAMEGRRLSGDHRVRTCQDAGADVDDVALDHGFKEGMSNYCQPETVLQTGKKGEFFNEDMCESSSILRRRHAEGVRIYCQKQNGFSAGTLGKKYNGICPKDLEGAFSTEFNRGRKNYLSAVIATNESAIGDLEVQIGRLEGQKFMYNSQLMSLPNETQTAVIVTDPYSGQQIAQVASPDPSLQSRRSDLQFQIQSTESQLYQQRQQEQSLRATNRDLQVEMTVL
jgi:hypothetical protein